MRLTRDQLAAIPVDEGGHRWVRCDELYSVTLLPRKKVCVVCGVIRRADGKNKPCRGAVSVSVRKDAVQ